MLSHKKNIAQIPESEKLNTPTYGSRFATEPIPKYEIPERGMPAQVASQLIRDELNLDGNAALNLTSFVTIWMDEEAQRLMSETLNKNYIDQDEYPQQQRFRIDVSTSWLGSSMLQNMRVPLGRPLLDPPKRFTSPG